MEKAVDLTYRVLKLPTPLVNAMRQARDAQGSTNLEFVADAIKTHLPKIIAGLNALGLGSQKGSKRPVRLPFSTQTGTLKALRVASHDTGISAIQLLAMCLVAATSGGISAKKRGRPKR